MDDREQAELIAELARDTIREVAPEELLLFRANSQAFFENPERALQGERSGDELLGFGTGVEVAFLTPIVLAVATEVVKFVVAEIAQSSKQESAQLIQNRVKQVFKKLQSADAGTPTSSPLTPTQLAHIRQIAYESASRLNVSANQADLLADSLVGKLAVS